MTRPGAERKAAFFAAGAIPPSRVPAFENFRRASSGSKGSAPGGETQRGKMATYEHVYLARQDVTAQQVESMTGQFKSIIEGLGGSVGKVEYWGVKSLAYRIRKNRKAHFSLLNLDAPHAAITEMERQMGLNEDVLRFMTLRVDALEEGPSAMMRKRDDGDRDDRGERRGRMGDRPPRRPREDQATHQEGAE